jgi:hypothetical protein
MRQLQGYFFIIGLSLFLGACELPSILTKEEPKPAPPPPPPVKVIKKTPVAPKKIAPTSKKVVPIPKVEPKNLPKICGLVIAETDRKDKSEQFYLKADRLFDKDAIVAAKKNLKTAICLNPKHAKAKELLQLLEQTYP